MSVPDSRKPRANTEKRSIGYREGKLLAIVRHCRIMGYYGVRIMYYWQKSDHEIWMLTLYSKSERASISAHILKQIAEAINREKA